MFGGKSRCHFVYPIFDSLYIGILVRWFAGAEDFYRKFQPARIGII